MTATPRLIPIRDAAKITRLAITELRRRVDNGDIPAATMSGEIYLYERDVMTLTPKEQTEEWKVVLKLVGVPIGVNQAAQKYGVTAVNVSRWVGRGLIKKLGHDPEHQQRVLIDEADVAYAAALFKAHGSKGKKIFTPTGAVRAKA